MTDQKMPQKTHPAKTISDKPKAVTKRPGQDKIFYMKFRPDFIDRMRTQLCAALNLETHAELPVYFRSPYAFPAAIGLKGALEKRYGIEDGSEAQKTLGITLSWYFRSSQYIRAMCDMPKRYGLDMEPDEEIQDGDRLIYQMKLKHHITATMERRKRERENSQNNGSPKLRRSAL